MPKLISALRDQDLGFLQIIAGFWRLSIHASDADKARKNLVDAMLDETLVEEVVNTLPSLAADALADLLRETGRLPWSRFTQQHGMVRQVGRAKRQRDRPHENNPSAAEILYYRGLVARAFMDSYEGMEEIAYVPDDLLPFIPLSSPIDEQPLGRPASALECKNTRSAGDHILDDATTILAGLRADREFQKDVPELSIHFIEELLKAGELVEDEGILDVDLVREFLESRRGEALAALSRTWITSSTVNDLHLVPSLVVEGSWRNDSIRTRRKVLDFLNTVPEGTWWSLNGFIAAIKEKYPEFQRPEGDFESWFLKDRETDEYLRGIGQWDNVEGALIRWLIIGPLFRLGIIDLASPKPLKTKEEPTLLWPAAFRLTAWAPRLLKGIPIEGLAEEDRKVHVRSDGRINVPRYAPRAVRYLLARFCDWDKPVRDEYRYRPTPSSLVAAADHSLNIGQLIHLLARHTDGIPPNVTKALNNWQKQGVAARIDTYPVLRLPSNEALVELRASRAARFLGDTLGPAAVALKPGAEQRVLAALTELGYLGEIVEKN